MNDLSAIILKSGINSLIYENDDSFKKSLTNSLSFKLNEAIKEIENEFSSKLMYKNDDTILDNNIKELINFFENYNPKTNTTFYFKNNTRINIQEQQLNDLKDLFNSLNSKNRSILAEDIFKNVGSMKRTLEFYEKAKRIIK